jgi:TIR domain
MGQEGRRDYKIMDNALTTGLSPMADSEQKIPTRPFLTIYVVWHPKFAEGVALAREIYERYRRNLYQNVAGGSGIPVVYRSVPALGEAVPIDIDLDTSETCAIVLLADENLVKDAAWVNWVMRLAQKTDDAGLKARLFPVAIDPQVLDIGISEQALRWFDWTAAGKEVKERRLLTSLSYQFCRMLRHYLEYQEQLGEPSQQLLGFLRRVDVFISHSKHDENGSRIATAIRKFLQDGGYDSFFDVFDIPIGLRFNKVLLEKVRISAVVAIHTDSYSSREWCRREMLEAKTHNVPLVVANCIQDMDERGFPYMANVPIVRMDPIARDRIDVIVCRLMDEVLKDFLWRCWVKLVCGAICIDSVAFLPRPPELIVLTGLKSRTPPADVLVYPDPPIGTEELILFEAAAPSLRLMSATEWLAAAGI